MQALILAAALAMTHHEPISFNNLVKDIKATAQQSATMEQSIYKTYNQVFGPADGTDRHEIGELRIEFDHEQQTIEINKFNDGLRSLNINVDCLSEDADIGAIQKIPKGVSGRQMMIFIDALLNKLDIKKASLSDAAFIDYQVCSGMMEGIIFIDLLAFQGKTTSWYENFGYVSPENKEEIAKLMTEIHDFILPTELKLNDGSTMKFKKNQKLGDVMMHYWETDKCKFAKIYDKIVEEPMFVRLHVLNMVTAKTKIFKANINSPPNNLFN